jgi:tetratricopeptide (TPR) repeat protein
VSGIILICLAGAAYVGLRSQSPHPPSIITAGLDPAVAKLIESSLREVRANQHSGAAWGKLGSVLMHYEFIKEAGLAFDQAEKLSPREGRWPYLQAILLMSHDAETAVGKLQRAVELTADRTDMPRLRLAQFLAERGRSAEAEAHFQTLLRLDPQHAPALLGRARLSYQQGHFTESSNLLTICLSDPHTSKSAHALLATIQQALGNASVAAQLVRKSASLPADQPWPDPYWDEAATFRMGKKALIEEATALMDQGRAREALPLLSVVTREYPDDDEAWYLMGWAFNQQQQSAQAEQALREHLRRSPQSPKGHAQLAVALLSQQRYAEAIDVLQAGVKLKPTWRELHFNLGYACVQLGRDDEAIRHFRDALDHDPNYVPSYTALAELLLRRSHAERDAEALVRQALELSPSDPRAIALLKKIQQNRAE